MIEIIELPDAGKCAPGWKVEDVKKN